MTITGRLSLSAGLLTVKQVAVALGCHPMTIYGWAEEGKIPHVRVGSRLKFDGGALAAWLEKRQVG